MKKSTVVLSLFAIWSVMASMQAMSATPVITGYVVDASGKIVRNGFGQCWHTGFWTPALAVPGCDGVPAYQGRPAASKVIAPAPASAAKAAPAPASMSKMVFTDKPITVKGITFDSGPANLKSAISG